MELHERLDEILSKLPGSVDSKAKALGTTNPTLYAYIRGKRLPNTEFLINLNKLTGVSLDWLLFGKEATKEGSKKIDPKYYSEVCLWVGQIAHTLFRYFFLYTSYDQEIPQILQTKTIEELERDPYFNEELKIYRQHPFFKNNNSAPFAYISLDNYNSLILMIYNHIVDEYDITHIQDALIKIMPFIKTALNSYACKSIPPLIDLPLLNRLHEHLSELAASKSHPALSGARELIEVGQTEDAIVLAFSVGVSAARDIALEYTISGEDSPTPSIIEEALADLIAAKSHPDLRGARELIEAGRIEDAIKSAFAVGVFAARSRLQERLK